MENTLTPVAGIDIERLPAEADFDPWGGSLDAKSAWKHFGGLTLADAYTKFGENPLAYQEDFMFMGANAFHYYFPVLEEYLRYAASTGEGDDCEATIIAASIEMQFESALSAPLRERIGALCSFVLSRVDILASSATDRERVAEVWTKLKHGLIATGS